MIASPPSIPWSSVSNRCRALMRCGSNVVRAGANLARFWEYLLMRSWAQLFAMVALVILTDSMGTVNALGATTPVTTADPNMSLQTLNCINANSFVRTPIAGEGTVTWQLTGIGPAHCSITFETSSDGGSTYTPARAYNANGQWSTSPSGDGLYTVSVIGCTNAE